MSLFAEKYHKDVLSPHIFNLRISTYPWISEARTSTNDDFTTLPSYSKTDNVIGNNTTLHQRRKGGSYV